MNWKSATAVVNYFDSSALDFPSTSDQPTPKMASSDEGTYEASWDLVLHPVHQSLYAFTNTPHLQKLYYQNKRCLCKSVFILWPPMLDGLYSITVASECIKTVYITWRMEYILCLEQWMDLYTWVCVCFFDHFFQETEIRAFLPTIFQHPGKQPVALIAKIFNSGHWC